MWRIRTDPCMTEHRSNELLLPSCAPWGKALDKNKSLQPAMYKVEKDLAYVSLMVPEDLPQAVEKSMLRKLQQNGRKMGNAQWESTLQQHWVCVQCGVGSQRGSPLWAQSSGSVLQSCLADPCAQPASIYPLFLSELTRTMSGSGRLKQMATALFSPKLTCGGKEMKSRR